MKEPVYRVPIRERLRVAWQHWRVRKVGRAMRTLSKAMKDDANYRTTWHANISMLIYDFCIPPRCHCEIRVGGARSGHSQECLDAFGQWANRNWPDQKHVISTPQVSAIQANAMADQMLKRFFDV